MKSASRNYSKVIVGIQPQLQTWGLTLQYSLLNSPLKKLFLLEVVYFTRPIVDINFPIIIGKPRNSLTQKQQSSSINLMYEIFLHKLTLNYIFGAKIPA